MDNRRWRIIWNKNGGFEIYHYKNVVVDMNEFYKGNILNKIDDRYYKFFRQIIREANNNTYILSCDSHYGILIKNDPLYRIDMSEYCLSSVLDNDVVLGLYADEVNYLNKLIDIASKGGK